MAAYAALVSLMNNMEQIQNHPRISTSFHKIQIESLDEKVRLLLDFVESYNSCGGSKEAEDLERQIASAAHGAEDVIESHVVDQIVAGFTENGASSLLDLQKLIEDMEIIEVKVMEVKLKLGRQKGFTYSMPLPSATAGKHSMVGFDEELIQLMDVLTGQKSSLQIISITGMGGMGKTTLARNVFENSPTMQHFDIRAWATISQGYSVLEILSQLLSRNKISSDGSIDELGEKLYKNLFGRRYLIVLDDMWSTDVWDKMKCFFPDNGNRSRVVITTRLSEVSGYCASSCFGMKFLNEDTSWILFCETVFGKGGLCPPALEKIGREIVEKCRGLPLSITVIGGLLHKSNRTTGYWKNISENLNSVLNSGEENCLSVLSLSYAHLPAHLKPCFLYMGAFKEDSEIQIWQIISLWVAEGFIKPNGAQIFEDIAEGYLEDLIGRNLILVSRRRHNGRIRFCRVHDLVRELCLKVGEKENFLCVLNVLGTPVGKDRERRFIYHDVISECDNSQVFHALRSATLARSVISRVNELPIKFKMLRVLSKGWNYSPESALQNFNLRFLHYAYWKNSMPRLPSSMSLIWNLQTFFTTNFRSLVLPLEIWKMPQLRHINCDTIHLPDPPQSDDEQEGFFVLRNLQTLSRPVNFKWSKEVCKRIPNIRKLCLWFEHTGCDLESSDNRMCYHLHDLGCLQKLELLKIEFDPYSCFLPKENQTFPDSLNKLSLTNSRLCWEDLTRLIGPLPSLEVLELRSVYGRDWILVDEQFIRLKFLRIDSCDIISWDADSCHFPVLEKLVLRGLRYLNEIPSGIGEIPTLELIRVHCCSMSAMISAVKIKDERETLGYDGFQLQVVAGVGSLVIFRKRVEREGLTVNDIQFEEDLFAESYDQSVERFSKSSVETEGSTINDLDFDHGDDMNTNSSISKRNLYSYYHFSKLERKIR